MTAQVHSLATRRILASLRKERDYYADMASRGESVTIPAAKMVTILDGVDAIAKDAEKIAQCTA